jgi:hypothetical protein
MGRVLRLELLERGSLRAVYPGLRYLGSPGSGTLETRPAADPPPLPGGLWQCEGLLFHARGTTTVHVNYVVIRGCRCL